MAIEVFGGSAFVLTLLALQIEGKEINLMAEPMVGSSQYKAGGQSNLE